jgi:hypothetical protein
VCVGIGSIEKWLCVAEPVKPDASYHFEVAAVIRRQLALHSHASGAQNFPQREGFGSTVAGYCH